MCFNFILFSVKFGDSRKTVTHAIIILYGNITSIIMYEKVMKKVKEKLKETKFLVII